MGTSRQHPGKETPKLALAKDLEQEPDFNPFCTRRSGRSHVPVLSCQILWGIPIHQGSLYSPHFLLHQPGGVGVTTGVLPRQRTQAAGTLRST